MGDEADGGIGVAQQWDDQLGHGAREPAAMHLAEPGGIGKPGQDVAQRAHRELDQDIATGGRVFVGENLAPCRLDLQPEAHIVVLGTVTRPAGSRSRTEHCRCRDRSAARARDQPLPGSPRGSRR